MSYALSGPLQTAVYAELQADITLENLVGDNIFDASPTGTLPQTYVALGPVYETKLKKMPWAPQGLEKLSRWKARVGDLPLVAIGGLTPERLPGVFEAGADSAAVVTDVLLAEDPEARTRQWLEATR